MRIFNIKSSGTVYNWIKSGKIKPNKIARRNYFKESDIKKLLE
jgi:predicted site-specific integrase-resolvase